MLVLKHRGNVYGAKLNSAEKKAMDIEINKAWAEKLKRNQAEINAIVLWVLHDLLGFGPKRLRRFFDQFNPSVAGLISRYELDEGNGDDIWLCEKQLKDYGIDIEQWLKEAEEGEDKHAAS